MFEEVFASYEDAKKGSVRVDSEYYVADGFYPNGDPRPYKRVRVLDTFMVGVMVLVEEPETGNRYVCTKSALKRKIQK